MRERSTGWPSASSEEEESRSGDTRVFWVLGICVTEAEGMDGGEGDGGAERLSGGCVAGVDDNGGGGYTDTGMSSAIGVLGRIRVLRGKASEFGRGLCVK